MNNIKRIQSWYLAQCDGDWEHQFGVQIETLDNPGWLVKINLSCTGLADTDFETVEYGVGKNGHPDDAQWLACKVEDNMFKGAGGPEKLDEILGVFCNWAEKNS
ncbi:MAG: immunity 53 family protein [bacterium]|nr:immunity 53 family protein [bacterium]